MTRRILLVALLAAACRESAQLPLAATTARNDPALRHYDVRFEQLPAPFATKSAGNPPMLPHGLEANRHNLEVAIDCAYKQKLIPHRFTVEKLLR